MAESQLRQSEREKKAPAYLQDYVLDTPSPPLQTVSPPVLPASDADDAETVISRTSHRSARSDLRKKQRDLELEASIRLMELEEKKVRLQLKNRLADIKDEEEDLDEEERILGFRLSGSVGPSVPLHTVPTPIQKAQDWVNRLGSTPPSPVPSNSSLRSPQPTPPQSVLAQSEAKSEITQLGEVIAAALQKATEQTRPVVTSTSTEKFIARQSFGRELPHFHGRPEQWLIFHSAFQQSSDLCIFSNSENLQRLQKCLKGEAYSEVEYLLSDPDNVPEILRVLQLRFGQKEHIIEHLLAKLQTVPIVKENDLQALIAFGRHLRNLVAALKGFKSDVYLTNPQMLSSLLAKLPVTMKMKWKKLSLGDASHSLISFQDWINQRVELAYVLSPPKLKDEKADGKGDRKCAVLSTEESSNALEKQDQRNLKCQSCGGNGHKIYKCDEFKKADVDTRQKKVMERKLCFGCLNFGHRTKDCRGRKKCNVGDCKYYHHPLLHKEEKITFTEPNLGHVQQQLHISSQITFQILPVILRGPKGEIATHALLDPGSAYTLLDEKLASQLQLPGEERPLGFSTIADGQGTCVPSRSVSMSIVNPISKEEFKVNDVRTFPTLNLHGGTVTAAQLDKWKYLKGLPIPLYNDVRPKILIGLPHHELIVPTQIVRGKKNGPAAGRTRLGWMVYGRLAIPLECQTINAVLKIGEVDSLHQLVKDFFTTEEFGVKHVTKPLFTKEEELAEDTAMKTIRDLGGRYEVGLLWKDESVELPESKTMALQRLTSVEKKLDRDPTYAAKYCENVQHYIDSGYLAKLSEEEVRSVTPRTWYLPHFGVSKASKPEKLRLVFDAAATSHGVSLNSQLFSGPDLLKPLPSVLCKFRERKVAISADIKEMFHQVRMRKEDQDSQRILWRGMDRDRSPDQYKMQVMTFGATCSPYCAQLIKKENATVYQEVYPRAAEAIINRHYVDDLLDSCDTTEEALRYFCEVYLMQWDAGFDLCNWTSNDTDFMKALPVELRSKTQKDFSGKEVSSSERILGLIWNPTEDCFGFSTNLFKVRKEVLSGKEAPTKREALSVISSIFDPLGFVSVLTVKAKILLQETWKAGIGWDDLLPKFLWERWRNWIMELQMISSFKVPRCYSDNFSSSRSVELHVFCDASELAMAAVAYFRLEDGKVGFVAAKSRVAPIKAMTIPRYELEAALIGARLANSIQAWHDVKPTKYFFWTDSRIVKCWLSMDSSRLKQYVANRVGEILELTSAEDWYWISTHENVADEATRDKSKCELSPTSRWLNGPSFLTQSHEEWQMQTPETVIDQDILEVKKGQVELVAFASTFNGNVLIDIKRFSSWNRLIRTTAFILRAANARFKCSGHATLQVAELEKAHILWWKWTQLESFPEIVAAAHANNQDKFAKVLHKSILKKLSVFLDDEGVLRLKGRVQADVPIGNLCKNPVILDSKHAYTKLLISHYHERAGHHGKNRVVNDLKAKFCIIGLREAVKKSWRNCQRCKNEKAQPIPPEMAPLPLSRLASYQRPFTQAGVDYFGPMDVAVGRRREKRYGALFTCLVTRAVHLELAGSLSTDSFIMALRRFISRRGSPVEMWSDNGTNFVGANNELKEALKELQQERIQEELSVQSINWNFIPPHAPHMGGSWERMVRSVKTALYATLKEKSPREETLQTFLIEAENTVNSHPLTYVDSDVEVEEVLTPNHFLLGTPNGDQPPGRFTDRDLIPGKQWRLAMRLTDHFWSRWIREFLPTLTVRQKWIQEAKPLEIGDVVIIVDDAFPRNLWMKGVVTEVPDTKDGQTRWAIVKTATGHFKRPTTKLCVLDVRK